jgi:hypothetical protein
MATFYMSETHPSFIMAERPPGRGWREAPRTDVPQRPTASVAELVIGLAGELAKSRELHGQMLGERQPASSMTFGEMVAAVMASENISFGDAASKVSRERPDLYDQHRRAPKGRYDYNDPEDGPYA